MANTFTAKMAGEGTIAATKGTIYTVPSSTTAYLGILRLFCTTAVAQTVNLYLKPGATSRPFRRLALSGDGGSYELDMRGSTLPTGCLVEADTTTASNVHYTLTAVEET